MKMFLNTDRYTRKAVAALPAALLMILFTSGLRAQNPMHANMQHGGHGESLQVISMPADDAVLPQAPSELMLEFGREVRLVKLTLHSAAGDWVDIGFRYDPGPGQHFVWPLPQLGSESFYTADWATIDANDEVQRGRFSFAFGPDAAAPSSLRPAEMEMEHIMVPDYRTLEPGALQ